MGRLRAERSVPRAVAGRVALALALGSLILAGCGGSRVSRADIERAAQGSNAAPGPAAAGQAAAPAGTGAAAATDTVVTAPGVTSAPGVGANSPAVAASPAVAGGSTAAGSTGTRPGAATAPTPAGSGARTAAAPAPGTPGSPGPAPAPGPGPGTAAAPAGALGPVVLGNVGDYSGVIGASMSSGKTGIGVWQQWVNANGGLNGHPVRVIIADSQGDPNRYQQIAKQMVEREGIIAFVGNQNPLAARGAAQYLLEKNVPVVGGANVDHDLWYGNAMHFPAGADIKTLAFGVGQLAVQQSKPKLGIIWCSEAAVCRAFNDYISSPEMKQKTNAELVYSAQASLVQPDYTAECLQARNRGVQALMLALDSNAWHRFSRSCAQQGYNPQYIGATMAFTRESDDPNLEGALNPESVFPYGATDTEPARLFQRAMAQYAPGQPVAAGAASAWVAGMLFREAARNLPAQPTSQDILNGLYSIKNDDLGGLTVPLTFTKGQPPQVPDCYFVVQIKNAKFTAPQGSKPNCY